MIARRPTLRPGCETHAPRPPRLRLTLAGLGALLALCAVAPEASAQSAFYASRVFYDEPEMLIPPGAVVGRFRNRGFTEIARPRFDGTAYIIDATDPAGARTRLFVDARDGAVLGRQRLDAPYFPSARPSRPAPGYGWTEEDVRPGRTARVPDGLIPPADIPDVAPRARRSAAAAGTESAPRSGAADANPFGLNPDGKARPAPSPRKTARLAPPQKPAVPSAAPAAPAPKLDSAESPKPEAAPAAETAKIEPPKAEPIPSTPAANQPQAVETPAVEKPVAQAPKPEQAWRDPPPDEAKRKVRVIDGATVVPGAGETAAPN